MLTNSYILILKQHDVNMYGLTVEKNTSKLHVFELKAFLKSYADIKACMYLVITFYTMMRASSIIFTAEISAITHMFILA